MVKIKVAEQSKAGKMKSYTYTGVEKFRKKEKRDMPLSSLAVQIEEFRDIVPLDAQLGILEPASVPHILKEALFGSQSLDGKPLNTYGVLDAAKVRGLPEVIESSGLNHMCLFQGKAAEEFRDVAPILVKLHDNHTFTRSLFTRGSGPYDLWDSRPCLFLRSSLSLVELRRHLRKFTRVKDEAGKWYYFRFWEPSFARAILQDVRISSLKAVFQEMTVIAVENESNAFLARLPNHEMVGATAYSVIIDEACWSALREHKANNNLRSIAKELTSIRDNQHGFSTNQIWGILRSWYAGAVRDDESLRLLTRSCMRLKMSPQQLCNAQSTIWRAPDLPITKRARLIEKATRCSLS